MAWGARREEAAINEDATHTGRPHAPAHPLDGCKSGLVFNPATPLDILKYVMDKVDIILLMSVNPGFGGQAFIPATLDKAREARKMIDESGYDIRLEIDGGVSGANIKEVAEAGVDMFVAGSAIFRDPGPRRRLQRRSTARAELAAAKVPANKVAAQVWLSAW